MQLRQLQVLQDQLNTQQSRLVLPTLPTPQLASQQPFMDGSLLTQIQQLTNQLLKVRLNVYQGGNVCLEG